MEREYETAGGDLFNKELGRFPCGRGRRRVVERKEDTGRDLEDHREHGRASEGVPVARAAWDVFGQEFLRLGDDPGALVEPVEHNRGDSLSDLKFDAARLIRGELDPRNLHFAFVFA